MPTSAPDDGARARSVRVTATRLVVALVDGREISSPLDWYPRLRRATPSQRRRWRLIGGGRGIHWPGVDEDLSVQGMLRGIQAGRDR